MSRKPSTFDLDREALAMQERALEREAARQNDRLTLEIRQWALVMAANTSGDEAKHDADYLILKAEKIEAFLRGGDEPMTVH